jgi:hypothetical protein
LDMELLVALKTWLNSGNELFKKKEKFHVYYGISQVSGLAEAVSEEDILKVGIRQKLSKPIDLYDLAVSVRNALDE